jgi:monofunctional biosynthetic peptidoglycan transglycosylase
MNRSRAGRWLLAAALAALAAAAVYVAAAAIEVQTYPVRELARTAPKRTALMREREREARARKRPYSIDRRWVPYGRISPALRRAVLIAEDDAFFSHGGLDWNEIQASARKNLERGRVVRGGSTITQQLAKNLYLGSARTPARKLKEALLAVRIERALTKQRIFELYLNTIEWGDGIYGIEAASRRYFGVPAAGLSPRQAVLLAAVIVHPRRHSVVNPGRRVERRVRMIASRMRRRGFLDADQYAAAIGREPPPAPWPAWPFGRRSETEPAEPPAGDSVTTPATSDTAEAAPEPESAPELKPDLEPESESEPVPAPEPEPERDPAPAPEARTRARTPAVADARPPAGRI